MHICAQREKEAKTFKIKKKRGENQIMRDQL